MADLIRANWDGACHNDPDDPKPMGIGVTVSHNGVEVIALAHNAGNGTSNEAEWIGLALCLKAVALYLRTVEFPNKVIVDIRGDSSIIVNQFNGKFRIRKDVFKPFSKVAHKYSNEIGSRLKSVSWVPRAQNKRADELSKEGRFKPSQTLIITTDGKI